MTPPQVVLSYGMGTDSTALLLRWLLEPATRPCDLSDILVITAQTGDRNGNRPASWSRASCSR